MHSAALFADEGSLEMDSQHFGSGLLRFVLLSDVPGDSHDRTKSLVRAGGYRGGLKRRGALFPDLSGDGTQRSLSSFPDVVAARTLAVHVHEAGNRCRF